ncbi:hypothetical protein DINM_021000 [Dirofilaria immitis]|nr:hypothetical protein [Dirofilaria immitis]
MSFRLLGGVNISRVAAVHLGIEESGGMSADDVGILLVCPLLRLRKQKIENPEDNCSRKVSLHTSECLCCYYQHDFAPFLRTFYLTTCNLLDVNADCQLYFVEHTNYMLIKSLKVDRNNTYCYPNLVKLHLRQGIRQISLMLVMKQAMNSICTLPIEIPSLQTVNNGQNAMNYNCSYSIFTSLPYAACSRLRDNSFILEPDLSFMDTTFSDIIYFINAKSIGSERNIQQFRINEYGNLVAMEKFVVYHPLKGFCFDYSQLAQKIGNREGTEQSNQFIVELDLKRSILYTFIRLQRNLLSECLFDLLFRPSHLLPKWIEFNRAHCKQTWLESFAVDGQLMMFTESIRSEMGATSELYLTNLWIRNSSTRLLHLDFVGDIGVLQNQTYADLSTKNIPTFGDARQLYTQSVRNIQLTVSQTSRNNTVLNITSPTTSKVKVTSTSTTVSVGRATIHRIDRFYSEIENNHSNDVINHKIWEEIDTQTTERPITLSPQYLTHQQRFTTDVSKGNDTKESEKKLLGTTEKTQDITLQNSNDSILFWEINIPKVDESKENNILDIDDHIYDNEMGNVRGATKETDIFQLPQQVNPEEEIVGSTTVGNSEMISSPNIALRSNCTLEVVSFFLLTTDYSAREVPVKSEYIK